MKDKIEIDIDEWPFVGYSRRVAIYKKNKVFRIFFELSGEISISVMDISDPFQREGEVFWCGKQENRIYASVLK